MTTFYERGFTLVETLIAISLLTTAIVTPMALATQSLSVSYYARDQIAAFHFGQEAIEAVRSIRDGNILTNARSGTNDIDLLAGIPIGAPFTIDTRTNAVAECAATCPPLQTDDVLFGYENSTPGWRNTIFTRTVTVDRVSPADGPPDEVQVSVLIEWRSNALGAIRSFTIHENMYRWVTSAE